MEREKLESMLIEYIDGSLGEEEKLFLEKELAQNQESKALYNQLKEVIIKMDNASQAKPSEALKNSFEHFLSQEIAKTMKPEVKPAALIPMFYRIAAGIILLMVAGVTGYWIRRDLQNQDELTRIKQELEANKRMMMTLLDNEYSASQRMQGVSVAYEMNMADDEIVGILVKTLNSDPNTNVRLAALDALSKFNTEDRVRKSLIESLSTQKDPVIQIALIQLMVKMKEKKVIMQLEKMTKDSKMMKAVKDEAYSGIFKLS